MMQAYSRLGLVLATVGGLGCDSSPVPRPHLPPLREAEVRAAPSPVPVRRTGATAPERGATRVTSVEGASWSVLMQGLGANDFATRLFATEALGCIHTAAAVAKLSHQLGDPEEDVRIAAVAALHRQLGAAARRELETVRDDEQESLVVRVLAASALVSPPQPCH